jgi:hypothetical protein
MEGERLISRTVQDAAGITFGQGVQPGTLENTCTVAVAGPVIGVTVLDRGVSAEFPNGFAQYQTARIMTSGVIWVETVAAVTQTDAVTYDSATQKWGITGGVKVSNARWDSKTTAAGVAKLSLGNTHPVPPTGP